MSMKRIAYIMKTAILVMATVGLCACLDGRKAESKTIKRATSVAKAGSTIRPFCACEKSESWGLSPCAKDSDSVNKYIMSKTDYIIEEYNGKKLKVTKEEYKYLMNNNPFKDLQCYVAVGRENGSKLQIGGQEYLEVIHQQPDTQFVVFVKSSIHQKNIPCYLITIRANGNGKTYANYIKHVKIKKINQRD